jgi:hypothetical protein
MQPVDQDGHVLTRDDAHRVEGPSVREPANVVDRDDAGVLELGGRLGLRLEADEEIRGPEQIGMERLQRNMPAEPTIPGEPDLSHAAPTEKRAQLVSIRLRR